MSSRRTMMSSWLLAALALLSVLSHGHADSQPFDQIGEELRWKHLKAHYNYMQKVLESDIETLRRGDPISDYHRFDNLTDATGGSRRKRASNNAPNCPVGYTGQYCESPVCSEPRRLTPHQGTRYPGELLEITTLPTCQETITLYVDSSVSAIEIDIRTTRNGWPNVQLIIPGGSLASPSFTKRGRSNLITIAFTNIVGRYGTGAYTVMASSNTRKPCIVTVRGTSTLVVDGGFVPFPQDDFVQEIIVDSSTENKEPSVGRDPVSGKPSFFAFKTTGVKDPGAAKIVSYQKGGLGALYPPSLVMSRYNCTAPLFAGMHYCDTEDLYHVKIRGVDKVGDNWQRVYKYDCSSADVPKPPPDVPPVNMCLNGGVLINSTDDPGYGVCYCGVHFTGPKCETKVCSNGGRLDSDQNCVCDGSIEDFSGDFCEHVKCSAPSGDNFDLTSRAFVFIIRVSKTLISIEDSIASAAARIVADFESNSPGYIQKYVSVFVLGGEIVYSEEHDNQADFLHDIRNLRVWSPDKESCTDSLYFGVSEALQKSALNQYSKSPIFIISDVLPDDGDDIKKDLLGQLSFFRGQIFTVLVNSDACPIDTHSEGVRQLRKLTQFSHGLLSISAPSDIENLLYGLGQGLKNFNELLSNDFLDTCRYAPDAQNFFIDNGVKSIVVFYTGGSLKMKLKDPTGLIVNPTSSNKYGENTGIAYFKNLMSGNYLFMLSDADSTPCSFRVFAEGSYDLFFGTSYQLNSDINSRQPVFDQDSHIVARINGLEIPDPENIVAEATIWTNEFYTHNSSRVVLYSSNGLYRDSCDYNLYFGAWKCPKRDLLFYINVYVTDKSGFTVMRTTTGYCSPGEPAKQPTTGCRNGGIDTVGDKKNCLCPGGWTGDKCQIIICQNGGSSRGEYCDCYPWTAGQYCEQTKCYLSNQDEEFKETGRSVLFLVHDDPQNRLTVKSMVANIQEAVQNIRMQKNNFIITYTLATFNDKGYNVMQSSRNPNDIVKALNDLASNIEKYPSSCENLALAESLYTILSDGTLTTKRGIVHVFTGGYPRADKIVLDELYHLVEESQIQLNFVMLRFNVCKKRLTDPEVTVMNDLAAATSGSFYLVQQIYAGKVLLTVPSLYSSGLVYENTYDDCTNGKKFYFPIDSQTQAFTIYLTADVEDEDQIVLSSPDKSAVVNVVDVWTDIGRLSRFRQVLRPCDGGWVASDNLCYFISDEAKNWTDAKVFCRNSGSALATIFHATANEYLRSQVGDSQFWIGLNDLRTINQWVWDQATEKTLSLADTGYNNWQADEPKVTVGRCVQLSTSGWQVADCTLEKRFACVRHPYDADFKPKDRSYNPLPQGTWSLSVKTEDEGCSVRIYAQSSIQVYNVFSSDKDDDYGYGQPGNHGNTNFALAHVTGFNSFFNGARGSLQYAQFYSADKQQVKQVQTFDNRDSCAYEYISSSFSCSEDAYQLTYTGMDNYGYPFQRIRPVVCAKSNLGQTCENNGVFFNSKCYCSSDYVGNQCEVPYCRNGVLSDTHRSCSCKQGFKGNFCETGVCDGISRRKPPTPTSTGKTLILIIDGSWTSNNADFLSNLDSVFTTAFEGLVGSNPSNWFNNIVGVVAYDSGRPKGEVSENILASNMKDFISKLSAELSRSNYKSASRSRSYSRAIINGVDNNNVLPRSLCYVVGDSSLADVRLQEEALDSAARRHVSVNFFSLNDKTAPGGASSYKDLKVASMIELSFVSGGAMYQAEDYKQLTTLWTTQVGSLFMSSQVAVTMSGRCKGLVQYILVASDSARIILEVFSGGQAPDVKLYGIDGSTVDLSANQKNSKTNYWYFVDATKVKPGIWRVEVQQPGDNPGPCYASIRSVSSNGVYSAWTPDVGRDQGVHSNIVTLYPIPGESANALLASAKGGLTLTNVQVFDKYEQSVIWASPLSRRENCVYEFISQHLFTCTTPSFTVALTGYDANGFPFRRIQHGHCVGMER